MNQMRMDAEGGGLVIHRSRRMGRLAVVVAVQNLLVFAFLVITLYVYQDFKSWMPEDVVHIQFDGTAGIAGNETISMGKFYKAHKMEVNDKNDTITIKCTGPYILYMDVCYGATAQSSQGELQLRVKERKDPVSSFKLDPKLTTVCRGLHSTVYLRFNEKASLYLDSQKMIIYNLTIGLSYMLGTKCDY